MILICSRCGGKHFHKKGFDKNNVQLYKCVSKLENGSSCGCRKQPIFVEEEELSELVDIQTENINLAKRLQKIQDMQRIERKSFRESTRGENALIEYINELRDVVSSNPLNIPSKHYPPTSYNSIGIVHLSDLHFNELVDIVGNKYDFNVASKRLRLLADKVLRSYNSQQIREIYVIFTGDLLNSDRRLDELLAMANNRATATFIAVKILAQFITHLAQHYNVKVISVTGNESRIRDELTHLDSMATDNFDFIIYEMLKLYLEKENNSIQFISGNTFEYVLSINRTNILIVHGHHLGKMGHTDISKAVSKWVKKGLIINFIICGHLHETMITDTVLRSGSLVGNNAYADVGLNLSSWASQNFYIIDEYGRLDATKVDLQNVDDSSPSYYVVEDMEAYNSKSIAKLKNTTSILKVVI